MATTIKQLKDKSGNTRLIAPVKMNHTMKWTVSGMVSGTSTLTNLDGSSGMEINIVLDKETASVPAKCITGTMLESQIGDGVVTYYKLGADVYTFSVVEGSGKLLTSGGAYSQLVRTTGTQTISGTKTFSSTTYSPEFRCEKTVSGARYDTAWRIGSNGKAYLRFKKTADESQDEWNLIEATHDSNKSVKVNGTWSFANEIGGTVEKAVCDADGSTLSEFLKGQTDAELSGIEQTPYSGISLTEYTSVARSDSSGKLVTRHRSLTIPQHGAFAILVSTENERTVRSSTTIALNLGNPFVIPAYGDCVLSVTLVWKNADGSISPQTLRRVQLRVGATSDWDSRYGYREVDVLTGEKTTVIIKVVNQTDVSNNCFVFAKTMDGNNIVAGAGDISGTCIFGKGFAIDATPDES